MMAVSKQTLQFLMLLSSASVLASCGEPTSQEKPSVGEITSIETTGPISQKWAALDRVARKTCPSTGCGVAGQLFFRDSVSVYELKDGWARITEYYDASCVDGESEYVDSGDKRCVSENGVDDGRFAEWVDVSGLADVRPDDPATGAQGVEKLVAASDDYKSYKDAFVTAAKKLIDDRTCTEAEFLENGGWVKSTTTYAQEPVYFMYCGGMTVSNRIYLNASTGRIFR
jgi:hypothetical protein